MLAGDASPANLSAAIDTHFTGAEVNDRFLFAQSSSSGHVQLLASEASAIPAEVIRTFDDGTPAQIEDSLVEFEGFQFFSINNHLWRTDGTAAGTIQIEGMSDVQHFFPMGNEIFLTTGSQVLAFDPIADFSANQPRELWRLENSKARIGNASELGAGWFEVVIVTVNEPSRRLVSNGTQDGTFLLDPFPSSRTWTLYALESRLVASVDHEQIVAVQPDGTFAELLPEETSFLRMIGTAVDGRVYFSASSQTHTSTLLWSSDGTAEGTLPVTLRTPAGELISDHPDYGRVDGKFLVFSDFPGTYALDVVTGVVHAVSVSPQQFGGAVRIENYGFTLVPSGIQKFELQRFDYDTLQSEVVGRFDGNLPSELLRLGDMLVFMSVGESGFGENEFSIYHLDYRTSEWFHRKLRLRGNEADDVLAIAVGDDAIFVERTDPATVVVSRIDSLRSPTGILGSGNLTSIASQYSRPHETDRFPYTATFRDSALRPIYDQQYHTRIDDRYFAFQAVRINQGLYISDGTHLGTTRVSDQEARFVTAVEGGIVFQTLDNSLWSARPGENARLLLAGDSSWGGVFDLLGVVKGRLIVSLRNNDTHIQSVWAVSTKEFTELATSTSEHPIGYAFRAMNQDRTSSDEPLVFRVDEVSAEEMRERGAVGQLDYFSTSWRSDRTVIHYSQQRQESYRRTWWATDGTAEGTRELFAPSDLFDNLADDFGASATFKGGAVWGTVAGHAFFENPSSGELREFDGSIRLAERFDDAWVILTSGSSNSTKLWRWSDGEAEPQALTEHSSPAFLYTLVGNNLYYVLTPSHLSNELWRTDGTAAGTQPVSAVNDLQPYQIDFVGQQESHLRLLVSTGDRYGDYHKSFWTTDGSEAGTFALESDNREQWARLLGDQRPLVVGDYVITANTRYALRWASLELAAEAREISLAGSLGMLTAVSDNATTWTADTPLVTVHAPAASSHVTLDVKSLLDASTRELRLLVSDGSVIELLNRSGEEAYYAFDPGCLTISIEGLDLQIRYVGNIRVIDRQQAEQVTFYSSQESETIRFTQTDDMPTVSVASGGQSASISMPILPDRATPYSPTPSSRDAYFFTMGGEDKIIIDDSFRVRGSLRIAGPITAAKNASLQIGESFSSNSNGGWIGSTKYSDGIRTNISFSNNNQAGTNPIDRFDVNFDGRVEPLDALLVINKLNADLRAQAARPSLTGQNRFADVSGDRAITPEDALLVINYLNRVQRANQLQAIAAFASQVANGANKKTGCHSCSP